MSTFGTPPFSDPRAVRPLDYGIDRSGAIPAFFNAVYAWMASGLALTAVIAWWVSTQPGVLRHVFNGPTVMVLFAAELVLVFTISYAVNRISAGVATALFLLYAALNGVTLSAIFLVYSLPTLAGAFVASAAMFGAMSVYGMVTRRDLSGLGSILFMALIGLIVASIVNIFVASTIFGWVISYIGVAIFVGLTAYDTQMLKSLAVATSGDSATAARYSINGALRLYLDFLNLFLMMLRILGGNGRR